MSGNSGNVSRHSFGPLKQGILEPVRVEGTHFLLSAVKDPQCLNMPFSQRLFSMVIYEKIKSGTAAEQRDTRHSADVPLPAPAQAKFNSC